MQRILGVLFLLCLFSSDELHAIAANAGQSELSCPLCNERFVALLNDWEATGQFPDSLRKADEWLYLVPPLHQCPKCRVAMPALAFLGYLTSPGQRPFVERMTLYVNSAEFKAIDDSAPLVFRFARLLENAPANVHDISNPQNAILLGSYYTAAGCQAEGVEYLGKPLPGNPEYVIKSYDDALRCFADAHRLAEKFVPNDSDPDSDGYLPVALLQARYLTVDIERKLGRFDAAEADLQEYRRRAGEYTPPDDSVSYFFSPPEINKLADRQEELIKSRDQNTRVPIQWDELEKALQRRAMGDTR